MRVNTALERMRRGEAAFGYCLGLGSPLVAEALGHSGIDFVMVDTQHGSFGPESTIASFMALAATPTTPIARVARNDYTLIGRLLDEGALGIVVPMVHTPEDAKAAADACRLPPVGTRSWGWGRAATYGPDYPARINDELFVAVQIESIQAVENAEAIMATPGVDGCWIGPADLGLSMGVHPLDPDWQERIAPAVEKVLTACRNTGKIPGYAAFSPEEAQQRAAQGFQFVTAGTDLGFMMEGALAGVKLLRG